MTRSARPLAFVVALVLVLGLLGLVVVDEPRATRLLAVALATEAKGSARITMTVSLGRSDPLNRIEGTVDLRAERARAAIRAEHLGGPIELLADGPVTYLGTASLPHFRLTAAGKPWVVVRSVTVSTGPGLGTDLLGGDGNPVRWLRLLRNGRVTGEAREHGTADVRGEPTTRYIGDADVAELLLAIGSGQARALVDIARHRRATGEVEAWVGGDGALRRLVVRVRGSGFGTTVTIELHDFGVPVDIVPPPPDQVHSLG
ncbi:MAG TPA: hypothetical protein VHF47_09620 [Acidimicrobiales bacterium]|nr:hypothetical protein [Acidimicrobiales bacterium]